MPNEKYTATINTGKVRTPEKTAIFANNNGNLGLQENSTAEIQKIRNVVMIIVGIHGFVSLLSLLSSLLTGSGVATSVIRTLLTAALLYQVLQGKNWARWVTVVLTILTALMFGLGALAVIALGGTGIGIFVVLIAFGYLACAIALLIPPASKYFDAR
jgi:hypothetical protein